MLINVSYGHLCLPSLQQLRGEHGMEIWAACWQDHSVKKIPSFNGQLTQTNFSTILTTQAKKTPLFSYKINPNICIHILSQKDTSFQLQDQPTHLL